MTNSHLGDRAAVTAGGGAVPPVLRTRPWRRVLTTFQPDTGVFAAARPMAFPTVITACQQITLHKYMTRGAVADGNASGSPPTWDPV